MQCNNFIIRLVMSVMLLGIVAGLCYVLPRLGSLNAVLAATLLLSLLVGAANCYCYIIRATEKSLTFDPKGWIAWILGRRYVGFVIIFILAFLSSLCFVIYVPSLNDVGFIFIFLAAPVFAGVYYCFRKLFERESVVWMITGRSLFWTLLVTPFLTALLYGLFLNCSGFVPVYDNLEAAIDAQSKPWEGADSDQLRNIGEWSILWGACRDFGFGQLFQANLQANRYIAVGLVSIGYWTLFFNICSLLAFFFVPFGEYKRLVLPLTPCLELPKISPKRFVPLLFQLLIVLVPLCSALLFWKEQNKIVIPDPEPAKIVLIKIGDGVFSKDIETRIVELQKKHRDAFDHVLAGPLGKLDGVRDTLADINDQKTELLNTLAGLQNNTFMELKKLHEEELFPRIDRNVDNYLDWYYSITAEYIRLWNLMAGNIEEHLKEKLNEYLMKNVNFQKAEGIVNRFSAESDKIIAQLTILNELAKKLSEQAAEVSEEVARIQEEFQIKWKHEVDAIIVESKVSAPEDMSAVIIDGEYASRDDFLASFQGGSIELSSAMERLNIYMNELHDLSRIFTYHSHEYMSFKSRVRTSNVIGLAGTGIGVTIGAKIASRIAGNQAFKMAVEAVAKMVVKRTIGGGGGAATGAAVGAGVGSVVPVVGTGIGAVAGGVIGGVGAWFASDYLLVKLEEHISRESFKREILSGVNEQKAEVIRALEDIFQVNRNTVPKTFGEPHQKQ